MKILAIEIIGNSAAMLILYGNKTTFNVTNLGKLLSIPKDSNSIKDVLEFQTNFSMNLQNQNIDLVVLCEGGGDSKKKRVRMEFAVLSECEKQNIPYETYASSACSKLINGKYEKDTGTKFSNELTTYNLPKYMSRTFVAGWRFIK